MDSTVAAAWIGGGAAFIGVGGTVIVAVTAARNTRKTNQATIDAAHDDAQLAVEAAREAQFADRYSRALEQLGSDNLDVRIGGIYALEGIALDSPLHHHPTVMEILTAFIREHSRTLAGGTSPERWPLPDVQTALTVVGRRKAVHDIRPMGLAIADLSSANLRGANLTGADLRSATLHLTDLTFANLTEANVSTAHLNDAQLSYANLTNANLWGAYLNSADLRNANLTGADLREANLFLTDLTGAYWPRDREIPEFWIADDSAETADGVVRLRRRDRADTQAPPPARPDDAPPADPASSRLSSRRSGDCSPSPLARPQGATSPTSPPTPTAPGPSTTVSATPSRLT